MMPYPMTMMTPQGFNLAPKTAWQWIRLYMVLILVRRKKE